MGFSSVIHSPLVVHKASYIALSWKSPESKLNQTKHPVGNGGREIKEKATTKECFKYSNFIGLWFWKAEVFPREAQQGVLSINPVMCRAEPAEPNPESQPESLLLPKAIPNGKQDYRRRLWALHGAARHRKTCLQKWKIRTKWQLQKNICMGTIRKRPKGDLKKKSQRPEELDNESVSYKLDLKISVTQSRKAVVARISLTPWNKFTDLNNNH